MAQFWQHLLPLVQTEHQRLRHVQPRRRGRPLRTLVTGALILDDAVHIKPRGVAMRGLGRHYSSSERRVVTGHTLFQALYVLLGRQCPLPPRLYRTRAACESDGELFQSKIEMAVETIRTFAPLPHTQTHVLCDSWYVCKAVWKAAKDRGFLLSGGLKGNRKLRRVAEDGTRSWQRIRDYAAQVGEADWATVVWPTDAGGQEVQAHLVRTLIHRVGACQLICVRQGTSTRYFVTSALDATLEGLIALLAMRWEIETFFEDLKELLGTDHYQVLHDRAVLRIWTLACYIYHFLEEQQALHTSHVSIGQARRQVREEHRLRLLGWLRSQWEAGVSEADLATYLTA